MRRDPDRFLEIKLSATALRLADDDTSHSEAIEQLRAIANGRTDILGLAAGQTLGGYLNTPATINPRTVRAAAFLVEAGADPRVIPTVVDEVRGRATHWGR